MSIKKINSFLKKMFGGQADSSDEYNKSFCDINYKGFKVSYSEGTSLIERIKK